MTGKPLKRTGAISLVQRALRKLRIDVPNDCTPLVAPTYADLFVIVRSGVNARRNVKILNDWLAFRHKGPAEQVCDVLAGHSPAQWVKAHAQFMRTFAHKAGISKAERRVSLRSIRNDAMRMSARADQPIEHARWEALRSHLFIHRDMYFEGIRKSDIPWNFEAWLQGESYGFLEKSRPKLANIERHLGLEEGTFLSHTRRPLPKRSLDLAGKGKACLYRISLEFELPERIKTTLDDYFRHKTDPAPTLRRNMPWTPNFKGEYPTRRAFEATIKAYWNFAVRPKAPVSHPRSGLGLDPERLEFIDFFRQEFLIAFLRWHFTRTRKATIGAVTVYFGPFASMMNRNTGWITQQPDRFLKELGRSQMRRRCDPKMLGNSWDEDFREWVSDQFEAINAFRRNLSLNTASAQSERIRDSFEKIDEILRLPQPMLPLFQLIRDHQKHQEQVIFINDTFRLNYETRTFFLVCLTCLPLRCLTWTALKLGRNIFRRSGRWVVRVERELFKNRRFLGKKIYEVTLPSWATTHFDHYTKRVRPATIGGRAGSAYLFPINSQNAKDLLAPINPSRLQHGIREATKQHWNAEIFPHAWRHICATGILKNDPEQIVLAATVLNDAPKTVMKAYAHILPDDTFRAYATLSDDLARHESRRQANSSK